MSLVIANIGICRLAIDDESQKHIMHAISFEQGAPKVLIESLPLSHVSSECA